MKTIILILSIILNCLPLLATDYFQQKVSYQIQVKLIDDLNRLEGLERITYVNNSNDTLSFIYFHLYLNRFMVDPEDQSRSMSDIGYQEIIYVRSGEGKALEYSINQTIMKLQLADPLAPADSQKFTIKFNALLPEAVDRLGYYGNHFDVGNWYPVPAVYDRFGWHSDIHYDGEFYQEWGDYEVDITVPRGYVVGATGTLMNDDAFPDSLILNNRENWQSDSADSSWVTYRFWAPQVHDFAWTADPEFFYRQAMVGETKLIFLIQRYRLNDWEPQMDIAVQAFKIFESRIGPYPYPALTVVDGYITAGGIEYPNLVIINDVIYNKYDLSATIIHEIAHQWFYGLLGNNQTRYGWMDEGFATFFENMAMQEIYGSLREFRPYPPGLLGNLFGYNIDRMDADLLQYLRYIREGNEEPINLHYDWFQNNPEILYYQKMGLVLSQLKLVIGDSLFWRSISFYYQKWKFKHPDPSDLQTVFETISQRNLSWFFDEWLNTTWHCDYAISGYKGNWETIGGKRSYSAKLKFLRKEPIIMPLDFSVYFKNKESQAFRIPVDEGSIYLDNSEDSILSAWHFNQDEKVVNLHFNDKISYIEIDPTKSLLDVNPFNNSTRRMPKIYFYWLKRQYYYPHHDGYTATLFPYFFYNDIDGLQLGIRTIGNYLVSDFQHRATFLLGLKSFTPTFDFWFEHPVYGIHQQLHLITSLYYLTGRRGWGIWLEWKSDNTANFTNFLVGWQFRDNYNQEYTPYPLDRGKISYLDFQINKGIWKTSYLPSAGEIIINAESPFLGTNFQYVRWNTTFRTWLKLWQSKKLFLSVTTGGQTGDVPLEKSFRLGGETIYNFMMNPYYRAFGTLPNSWWTNGHIYQDGGGHLRSLANDWQSSGNYWFSNYLSLTIGNPLHLGRTYIPYLSDMLFSVYTSWSSVNGSWGQFSQFYGEAGLSLAFERIPFILNYFDVENIHLDFPFWVNNRIDPANTKFRWVLRLDIRSFY